MSFDPALFEHIESSPNRTVSAAQAALHLGNQPVPQVRRKLIQLADASGGSIQSSVNSPASTLVFVFPPDWRQRFNRKFWTARFKSILYQAGEIGFKVLRVAFGVSLIISILLLFISIVVMLAKGKSDKKSSSSTKTSTSSSSSSSSSSNGGSPGSGFRSSVGLRMTFRDWLWFMYLNDQSRYNYAPAPVIIAPSEPIQMPGGGGAPIDPESTVVEPSEIPKGPELGFFEAIFSFVFGASNPNRDFERHETQRVGKVIRSSGGTIVKENILHYLDNQLINAGADDDQERFMLPLLEYFNGEPRAWDGDLVYFFPELVVLDEASSQKHASNSAVVLLNEFEEHITPLSQPLLEREWIFSRASPMQTNVALCLAVINISELFVFSSIMSDQWAEMHVEYPVISSIMWVVYIILCVYAACFCIVPITRWFLLNYYINPRIRERNEIRKHNFVELRSKIKADPLTMRRIRSAKEAMSRLVMERFGEDAGVLSPEETS